MVNDMKRKKRQEKNFLTFFRFKACIYRRFDEKLIPMSND